MRRQAGMILAVLASAAALFGCSGEESLTEFAGDRMKHIGDQIREAADPGYQEEALDQAELEMKYYYSLLDGESRQIYRELVQGQKEGKETIVTHGNDPAKVNEICTAVYRDYPEFFWCSGTVETTGYSGISSYCEVKPEYTCTMEERSARQQQIDAAAEACLSGLPSGGSYEKIRYLYEWIVQQTEDASDAADSQNIYSVFGNRRSVCAGYARAFQYLAERSGIRCIYVTGTVKEGESHAWNIVDCDGTWYNVDVTFGDPVYVENEMESGSPDPGRNRVFYDYLCVSDGDFRRNHTPDASLVLPECSSDALEYYRMIGRYFETADRDEMLSLMQADIERGDGWSDFKYASDAAYQAAETVLEDVMGEAARYLCGIYGLSSTVYQYSLEPDCRRISVYWDYGG